VIDVREGETSWTAMRTSLKEADLDGARKHLIELHKAGPRIQMRADSIGLGIREGWYANWS